MSEVRRIGRTRSGSADVFDGHRTRVRHGASGVSGVQLHRLLEGRPEPAGQGFFRCAVLLRLHVIPLFILMGQIAFNAGIAKRLYAAAYKFIGHIPGGCHGHRGWGHGLQGDLRLLAGDGRHLPASPCGDGSYGYDKNFPPNRRTVGTLGSSSRQVTLIVFGIITEQSSADFSGGSGAGLMVAAFFICIIYGGARSIRPWAQGRTSTWKERMDLAARGALDSDHFHLGDGGLMQGFFTPTEAGSVGTLPCFSYRSSSGT